MFSGSGARGYDGEEMWNCDDEKVFCIAKEVSGCEDDDGVSLIGLLVGAVA